MAVPNLQYLVAELAAKHPEAWRNAHTGNAHTEDFAHIVAAAAHAIDPKFGLCGQRGDPNVIGDDSLTYKGEGDQYDPTDGNKPITVIDFIGDAGTSNARPAWGTYPGNRHAAAWVQPRAVAIPPSAPAPSGSWRLDHAQILELCQRQGVATTQRIAEQFAHSFPGEGWGCKKADAGRPVSGDVIARLVGDRLVGFRVIGPFAGDIDLRGQVFVPVSARNHLEGIAPVPAPIPVPPPVPPPPPAKCLFQPFDGTHLAGQIALLQTSVIAIVNEVAALHKDQDVLHRQLANIHTQTEHIRLETQDVRRALSQGLSIDARLTSNFVKGPIVGTAKG